MKVKIIKFGRPAFKHYEPLCAEYYKRLQNNFPIEVQILKVTDERRTLEQEQKILRDLDASQRLICLDERGKSLDSTGLADKLQAMQSLGQFKQLILVIGGPYGLSPDFRAKCHEIWKITDFVVTSDLAWLILSEQLYRAWTINQGIPYHHE